MEDLRRKKSREMLKRAFWRVLKKKKYKQITIKDLVEEAQLNRKTFNAHYEDIDALMNDCVGELFDQALRFYDFTENGEIDFPASTRKYTEFALANRDRLVLLLENQLDGVALQALKSASYHDGNIVSHTPSCDNIFRQDLFINYSIHSSWGHLLWVLAHADLSVDELVNEALYTFHIFLKNSDVFYKY